MALEKKLINFILHHQNDDVNNLVLKASRYPGIDIKVAAIQIAARQMALKKIPLWCENDNVIFPPHISMEQCSSQYTAQYKASLFYGDTFVDLTAGLGVDFFFISRNFEHAHYIERQQLLCDIAINNMQALGAVNTFIHNVDAIEYLKNMSCADLIMIDPARRDSNGGKTVSIADCEPDVSLIEDLLVNKAAKTIVKLSPMLDISVALKELKHVTEVHVVSVNNECKELLVVLEKNVEMPSIYINCVNISDSKTCMYRFFLEDEAHTQATLADEIGTFLYEPNSSIMKGGGYKLLTERYNVRKLAVNTNLYTSHELNVDFPGRKFQIIGMSGFSGKNLKNLIGNTGKANLSIRNFPSTVADLRKKLKLKDGGGIYLFATTLWDGRKVIIKCNKIV